MLRSPYSSLTAIILLGFVLRMWMLGAAPLRGDEAFAAQYWAGLPPTSSLTTIAPLEPHPPLTYVFFWLWGTLAGTNNELALRILPVLANTLGIATAYAVGTRLAGRRVGIVVALIWAVHPFLVWHSRDFRNYAVWAALSAQTLYFAILALKSPSRRTWMLYSLLILMTSLTFYFELFILGTYVVMGILQWRSSPRTAVRWFVLNSFLAGIVLLVFVVLQGALFRSGGYSGNTEAVRAQDIHTLFIPALSVGETLDAGWRFWTGIAMSVLSVVSALSLLRFKRPLLMPLSLLVGLPFVALIVVSTRVSVFSPRYIISLALPLSLLIIVAMNTWKFRSATLARLVIGTLYLAVCALSLSNTLFSADYRKAPDWFAVRNFVRDYVASTDLIIQTTVDSAFGYYINPLAPNTAIPSNPAQTDAEIAELLENLSSQYADVWLFEHSFMTWQNAHAARQWLDAHMQSLYQTTLMGRTMQHYRAFAVQTDEVAQPLQLSFGAVATLRGVTSHNFLDALNPWLYWECPTDTNRLAVSVQLIGAVNPITQSTVASQSDHALVCNGTLARDPHTLSVAGLPAGSYTLIVKLYEPISGEVVRQDDAELVVLTTLEIK